MELLPCPFCGSADISQGEVLTTWGASGTATQSMCHDCGALGPEAKLPEGEVDYGDVRATAAWNRRADAWIDASEVQPATFVTDDSPCTLNGKKVEPAIASARVLVSLTNGKVRTDRLSGLKGYPVWWETYGVRVTHWKLLPAPAKLASDPATCPRCGKKTAPDSIHACTPKGIL